MRFAQQPRRQGPPQPDSASNCMRAPCHAAATGLSKHIGTLQRVLLALSVSAVVACNGSDGSRLVVRDSAGIQIVENVQPDSSAATWWHLSQAPEIDIGAVEGSEAETLFRVTDVKRLTDGRLVVANSGASQVRFYRSDGTLEAVAGKSGSGPGEFQRITEVTVLPDDSVAILDPAARRFTLLDAQGGFVRNFAVNGVLAGLLGPGPSGSRIGSLRNQINAPPPTTGTVRPDVVYGVVSSDGSVVTDTIARFAGNERHVRINQTGGQITSIEIMASPFGRKSTVRLHGDALTVGTQDAPELRVYGLDGALRRIIRTANELTPVTQDHIDRIINRMVASVPEPRVAAMRKNLTELATAKFLPPYGTFLINRSGQLWLQDYPGLQDGQRWTVFDSQGGLVARVAIPDRFTPFDIGADWIAGKELDELEVEHVRVYRIMRTN